MRRKTKRNAKEHSTIKKVVKYRDLENFIKNKMKMEHIYQPVMIKTLLESDNKSSAEDIARAFLERDQSQIDYYKYITNTMPGKVLRKHDIVSFKDGIYSLNIENLRDNEKNTLIKLCNDKLKEYEEKHGKTIWQHRARDAKPISGSLRYDVLARAKGRCEACGVSVEQRALDVDHIIPRNKGGKTEIGNLQALCYKGNSEKRDRDTTDFRIWKEKFDERDKSCVFCKLGVSSKESNLLAFAVDDAYPVTKFHMLICPRRHVSSFFDLVPAEKNHCLELIERLKIKLLEKDKTISGFNVGINDGRDAGQTVMHCHFHLIPRRNGDVDDPTGGIRNVISEKGKY